MNVCKEMKSQSDCFMFIWTNAHLVSTQFGTTLMFGLDHFVFHGLAFKHKGMSLLLGTIKVTIGGTSFMAGIPFAKSLWCTFKTLV